MRFLLDTGCGASGFIREDLAKAHSIPQVQGKSAESCGWGGTKKTCTKLSFYKIENVELSQSLFKNVELLSRKDFWEYDVDGMLCAGLLKKKHNIFLDYSNQTFLITESAVSLPDSIPFDYRNEREILVGVKINGEAVENFNFDTGSHVIHISNDASDKLQLKQIPGEEIEIGDTKGDTEKARYVLAKNLCMGRLCKNDLKMVSSGIHSYQKDFRRNGILGYPFFQGHKFVISFPKRILYYE